METLPPIDLKERQVFNGVEVSLGIAPILHTFSVLSTQRIRPTWDLFLINMETLIRDRRDDQLRPEQIADGVLQDCNVLAQYIAAYCRVTTPHFKTAPILCFYFAHYEKIPKAYLRTKLPKGTEERWHIRDIMIRKLYKDPFPAQVEDLQVVFMNEDRAGSWPHRDLLKDLYQLRIANSSGAMHYRKVLMVSHIPLDFNLYKSFSQFTILESYTGNLKQIKQLGKKVFKDDSIPFNKYTLLALGDKWYLESPLTPQAKKQLKEKARFEHWTLLPDSTILEKLVKSGICKDSWLTAPDL